MTYEELKQQITNKLLEIGFKQDEEMFTQINRRQHQVIINGQASVQEKQQVIKFTILGEGAIDNDPTIGLNLTVEDRDIGDFWISSVEDLKTYFNI